MAPQKSRGREGGKKVSSERRNEDVVDLTHYNIVINLSSHTHNDGEGITHLQLLSGEGI